MRSSPTAAAKKDDLQGEGRGKWIFTSPEREKHIYQPIKVREKKRKDAAKERGGIDREREGREAPR